MADDSARRRWGEGLQPIPETGQALDELEPGDLLLDLLDQGRRVRELVPDSVGLSLATFAHGVTLTLVASDRDFAMLDALRDRDAGSQVVAVEADEGGAPAAWESRWRLFAEASSAVGVRSSLSLPILVEDVVVGSVNLYAASPRAFDDLHEEVAAIFDAWAPGAVSNADLSFTTRDDARRAPQILRESARIDAAVGLLVSALDLDERDARRRLHDAALRGGVEEVQLAGSLLSLLRGRDTGG